MNILSTSISYVNMAFGKFSSLWTKEKEILAAQAAHEMDKIENSTEHQVTQAVAAGAPEMLVAAEHTVEQTVENAMPTVVKRARKKSTNSTNG